MTHPGRLSTFLSILCIVLAGVLGLVLALIHPGWAVRLTRYVSRSMVGGRRRRLTGRHTSQTSVHGTRRPPASKSRGMYALPDHKKADEGSRKVGLCSSCVVRRTSHPKPIQDRHYGPGQSNVSQVPGAIEEIKARGSASSPESSYSKESSNSPALRQGSRRQVPERLRTEVQSTLVNLGMSQGDARGLAKQAVRGRDFDSALRWAISNRMAA